MAGTDEKRALLTLTSSQCHLTCYMAPPVITVVGDSLSSFVIPFECHSVHDKIIKFKFKLLTLSMRKDSLTCQEALGQNYGARYTFPQPNFLIFP